MPKETLSQARRETTILKTSEEEEEDTVLVSLAKYSGIKAQNERLLEENLALTSAKNELE